MEELTTIDLVTLHLNLSTFADYHQLKGGQNALDLLKEHKEQYYEYPQDGSRPDYNEGYAKGLNDCINLLRKAYVK